MTTPPTAPAPIETPLADLLRARIAREGPLSLADYMTACLWHPHHGYYATRDPLGAAGDFITAPEISQMFGELIGLWLAQVWMDQGAPARFVLAELGPGRGTLMQDLLRATRGVPGFHAAMELVLVERSAPLRAAQAARLAEAGPDFVDAVAGLPAGPLYLIANEFFDALPIRQFQRGAAGWHERQIGLDAAGQFIWGLSPPVDIPDLAPRWDATAPGQIVEHCPAGTAIAGEIGARLAAHGGAALLIDYGAAESLGDTFQALRDHRYIDPLESPGAADLTAHVAFGPLMRAAAPAQGWGPVPQGVFLRRLGLDARADALAYGLTDPQLEQHRAAARRLTDPAEMGELFKVCALTAPSAPHPPTPPPGLDPI